MKLRYSGKYTKLTVINLQSTYSVGEETNISQSVNGGHGGECLVCELGALRSTGLQLLKLHSSQNSSLESKELSSPGCMDVKILNYSCFYSDLFSSSEKIQFPDRKALYCCCHWLTSCHFKHPLVRSCLPLP